MPEFRRHLFWSRGVEELFLETLSGGVARTNQPRQEEWSEDAHKPS